MTNYADPGLPLPIGKDLRQFDRDLLMALSGWSLLLRAILDGGLSLTDNVDCAFVTYTSNAAPDTQDTVAHTLGKIPTGYIPVSLDKAGIIYKSGTFTASNLLLKCNVASTTATLLVF